MMSQVCASLLLLTFYLLDSGGNKFHLKIGPNFPPQLLQPIPKEGDENRSKAKPKQTDNCVLLSHLIQVGLKRTYGMYKFRLKRTYGVYKFRLKRTYGMYKFRLKRTYGMYQFRLKRTYPSL